MEWITDTLLWFVAANWTHKPEWLATTLFPATTWFFTSLIEPCEPLPLPPNVIVIKCADLGFLSTRCHLDFTLQYHTNMGAWFNSSFTTLNMSDPVIYASAHGCNIKLFLYPLLIVTGLVLSFLWKWWLDRVMAPLAHQQVTVAAAA